MGSWIARVDNGIVTGNAIGDEGFPTGMHPGEMIHARFVFAAARPETATQNRTDAAEEGQQVADTGTRQTLLLLVLVLLLGGIVAVRQGRAPPREISQRRR